jgi:hypothetical protein
VPGTPKGFTPSAVPCSFDLCNRRAVNVTFSSRGIHQTGQRTGGPEQGRGARHRGTVLAMLVRK